MAGGDIRCGVLTVLYHIISEDDGNSLEDWMTNVLSKQLIW